MLFETLLSYVVMSLKGCAVIRTFKIGLKCSYILKYIQRQLKFSCLHIGAMVVVQVTHYRSAVILYEGKAKH